MSLPSYANFFDKDDNELGSCFVNCGWYCTIGTIVGCISESVCKSEEYKNPDVKYFTMYGLIFQKELIEDCANMSFKDVNDLFTQLHDMGVFTPPETRKRKVVNRTMYSKSKKKKKDKL